MFFSQANRNKVKEENPEASFGMYLHTHFWTSMVDAHRLTLTPLSPGQLGKILGQKWKEMSDDDKKVK
jgi:hypothetical protein